MMHSGLYGKSRAAMFAEGNAYITLSNTCSYGQKTDAAGTGTTTCQNRILGP